MSKNIYRIKKKSDLDEIMKNNFYKPICVIFISKSNSLIYDDLCTTLLSVSKLNSYNMTILIDFDDFIDNIDYFSSIKNNVPYFMAFFKGKVISSLEYSDNFIPILVNQIEQIHNSYINKLRVYFNQENNENNINNINNNNTNEIINNTNENIDKNIDKNINESIDETINENKNDINDNIHKKKTKKKQKQKEIKKNDSDDNSDNNSDNNSDDESNYSIRSNNTEQIEKKKEKLKKLKKIKELKDLLDK